MAAALLLLLAIVNSVPPDAAEPVRSGSGAAGTANAAAEHSILRGPCAQDPYTKYTAERDPMADAEGGAEPEDQSLFAGTEDEAAASAGDAAVVKEAAPERGTVFTREKAAAMKAAAKGEADSEKKASADTELTAAAAAIAAAADSQKDAVYAGGAPSANSSPAGVEMALPAIADNSFKAWMPYTAITNRASRQYRLQQECWTDGYGFRRHGEDYCVALGSYYSKTIGERFEITLDSGCQFTAVLADLKSDRHTDPSHMYYTTGGGRPNLVEFLVDQDVMADRVLDTGSVSDAGFAGKIIRIVKLAE